MLSVLLEGTLTAAPVSRISSRGTAFATALMRVAGEDGETVWCSVIAFSASAAEALLALASGDTVAVAGHAAICTWEKAGASRAGLKVTATCAMSAYEAGQRSRCAASASAGKEQEA